MESHCEVVYYFIATVVWKQALAVVSVCIITAIARLQGCAASHQQASARQPHGASGARQSHALCFMGLGLHRLFYLARPGVVVQLDGSARITAGPVAVHRVAGSDDER